jgi:hypothetical protein
MNLSEEDIIDTCVQCGKRQNAVSNLTDQVFLVNTANKCGHKFCMSCVERELYKKRQFACPRCKSMVSRDKVCATFLQCDLMLALCWVCAYLQLSTKSLDETEVERDFSIRRKIKALFNKVESDFSSLEEYKNYEELVEDIIYNLVNVVDVDATNALVEKYKQENSKEIVANQFKRKEELKEELMTIKESEEHIAAANQKFQETFRNERAQKQENKRQLNQVMLGVSTHGSYGFLMVATDCTVSHVDVCTGSGPFNDAGSDVPTNGRSIHEYLHGGGDIITSAHLRASQSRAQVSVFQRRAQGGKHEGRAAKRAAS